MGLRAMHFNSMSRSVGPGLEVGRGVIVRGEPFDLRMEARCWLEGMDVEDMVSGWAEIVCGELIDGIG